MNPLRCFADAIRTTPVYRSTWFLPGPDDAKLNHNESAFELPDAIKRTIIERIAAAPWHRYPDAHSVALTEAFAAFIGVGNDSVAVGPGGNALIGRLLSALHPDATLIVCPPAYYVYPRFGRARGLHIREVPLTDRDTPVPFDIDADAILDAGANIERPVLCLTNPNNPTANAMSRGAMARLIAEFDGLLIVDEAYCDFANASLVAALDDHPGLVLVRTLSKAAALAGWRIGALVANPAIVAELDKPDPPYHLGMPAQVAGETVLANPDFIRRAAAATTTARDELATRLAAIDGVRVFPSATNFLLLDLGAHHRAGLQALVQRRVVVRDVDHLPGLANCIRVSLGTAEHNNRVVDALQAGTGAAGSA